MAKLQLISINNFSGGISDDPRKVTNTEFQISKHFDIFSKPNKLIPYRSLSADTNDGSTSTGMKQYFLKDFIYASTSAKLYALGQNASGKTKIVYKADATTGNWTLPASSEGNGAVKNGCFVEFKDYMFGFQGTNQIFKWGTLSGTPTITDSVAIDAGTTLGSTITSVAQGLIGRDDNLYLPYNNKLVRVNGTSSGLGTIQDAVLTLPTNLKIVSLANYGNYLAIGCAPVASYNGTSKVFIWNLRSSDVTETIDFGEGDLRLIETIEGQIIGVTDRYLNNSIGAGIGSLIIQNYSQGSSQVVKELFTTKLVGSSMPIYKAVKNNRLFFSAKIMTNSTGTEYNEGIWSFGRKNANYPFVLSLDIIDENVNSSGIQSFGLAGNYFFISHSADGSIDKTSSTETYSFTSIYESQIYNLGDASMLKRMTKFSITTDPIVTGTITCKLKVDDDSSWTTFGTYSTTGGVARDFFNIESSQLDFPTFGEIKLRLESTGGAIITGYSFLVEPLQGSEG